MDEFYGLPTLLEFAFDAYILRTYYFITKCIDSHNVLENHLPWHKLSSTTSVIENLMNFNYPSIAVNFRAAIRNAIFRMNHKRVRDELR